MRMGRLQKINHFPGMLELVRKAGTARNLNKMLKAIGKDYKFFPKTFMLPADYTALKQEFKDGKNHGNKTFIVKPSKGCQGTGIRLTRCLDDIDPHEPNIVQRYMHRPHLLEGYKYDLRLYVLLSSLTPMRIFLYREGLVRICTQKYQPVERNLNNQQMHLTNYAINKNAEDFVQPEDTDDDSAHKRTVSSLMHTLEREGVDTETLWEQIGELCVKTIISVQPHLEHTYFTCRQRSDDTGFGCFELLGFDVIIDHKLKPFLLEVNHSPSFTCDSALDETVKTNVLKATMELVSFSKEEHKLLKRQEKTRLTPESRHKLTELREEYEAANCDRLGFDQLYPPIPQTCHGDEVRAEELHARYDEYLDVASALYNDMSLTGSRRQSKNCGSFAANYGRAPPQAAADEAAGGGGGGKPAHGGGGGGARGAAAAGAGGDRRGRQGGGRRQRRLQRDARAPRNGGSAWREAATH